MRTWVIRNIGGVMTVQQLSEFESDLPAASPFSQWLDELDLTDQKVRILFYLRKVLEDIHLTRCEKILNILCQKEEEDK
jgi:hypothetical protein